jgi:methyl-accepting chemotaxis protein
MVQTIIFGGDVMSIAKKMGLAISPLVFLCVCLVIFSYHNIKQIQGQIPNISEFAITSTQLAYSANTAFYRQTRFYEEVVFMHDLEMLAKAEEASREVVNFLEKLRGSGISPEMRRMIDNYLEKHKKYTDSSSMVYKKMSEDEKYLENAENALNVKHLGEEKNLMETILKEVSGMIRKEVSQKIASVDMSAKKENNIKASISFIIIGVSVLVIFILIKRGIIASISRVIKGLNESSERITFSSGQIFSACQAMAQGASEQAASSQEITSTMEEIAAVTGRNADHAKHADLLMNALKQAVEFANQSMAGLSVSIEEISKAGDQTSGIMKSIEKIAFQTNLLALNAAVEAARAGEFGAGFAVVAGEVRSLAARAAEDSKNTSDLLSDISQKVNDGTKLVSETREAFARVVETSVKVTSLMKEISSASVEQASRIKQVSGAVAESDRVIQQSAANTEESASASEEMNSQAEQMKQFVDELVLLVSGNKAHTLQA